MQMDNKVQLYRKKIGLTQEELGKQAGVTRQTIISMERGNYTPSVSLAFEIARALKTPVDNIFSLQNRTKSHTPFLEIILAVTIGIILLFISNPFKMSMKGEVYMVSLSLFGIFILVSAILFLKFKVKDERDYLNKMIASRISFIITYLLLSLAIIIQGLSHSLDYWIIYIFSVMLFIKLVVLIYLQRKK